MYSITDKKSYRRLKLELDWTLEFFTAFLRQLSRESDTEHKRHWDMLHACASHSVAMELP